MKPNLHKESAMSVFKRGNVWWMEITGVNGKPVRKTAGTDNKEVAELKLEQMMSFHEIRPNGQKLGSLSVRIEPAPG